MLDYLASMLGLASFNEYENILIPMACFFTAMMFILFVDILVNGFFGLFRKERRK